MFNFIKYIYLTIFCLLLLRIFTNIWCWITPNWFSWNKFSETTLHSIEKKILSYLKSAYRGWYVDIGPTVGTADRIWTISLNAESPNTPLVLFHGLGAGVAFWCLNLDAFAATRPVYAIDMLGFGRSSRPTFSSDPLEAEKQYVKSIEEWRHKMNLDKMIILGHSMGGFLAASYSLTYPQRVQHLILADPWGFPEKLPDSERKPLPIWIRAVSYVLALFYPFTVIRVAGPWGQWIIDKFRPDIAKKFTTMLEEDSLITQYVYQCNSQRPSGESAFHCMDSGFGWAKIPMVNRIEKLDKNIPMTLLYGERSWVDHSPGELLKKKRSDSYVQVQVISSVGHHVYADKPDVFNKYVIEACKVADGVGNSKYKLLMPSNIDKTESELEEDVGSDTTKTPVVNN